MSMELKGGVCMVYVSTDFAKSAKIHRTNQLEFENRGVECKCGGEVSAEEDFMYESPSST
jgi:hypothetical protein